MSGGRGLELVMAQSPFIVPLRRDPPPARSHDRVSGWEGNMGRSDSRAQRADMMARAGLQDIELAMVSQRDHGGSALCVYTSHAQANHQPITPRNPVMPVHADKVAGVIVSWCLKQVRFLRAWRTS